MIRVLVGVLVVAVGVQTVRLNQEQAAHAEARAGWHRATLVAVEAARAEERRRADTIQKEVDHARAQAKTLSADLAVARASGGRLRDAIAALRASTTPTDTTPAPGGPTTPAPADMLALVQQRLDEAAEQLAGFADQAHLAGATCQRLYGALTPPQATTPSATP